MRFRGQTKRGAQRGSEGKPSAMQVRFRTQAKRGAWYGSGGKPSAVHNTVLKANQVRCATQFREQKPSTVRNAAPKASQARPVRRGEAR